MKQLPTIGVLSDTVICPSDGLMYAGFPAVEKAMRDPNGLLAIGGEYSAQRLYSAFQRGIFPWTNAMNPNLWWSPDPRCVFKLVDWRPSRSLRRLVKNTLDRDPDWKITFNQQPERVLRCCSERNETWLCKRLIQALLAMHQDYGCLISVEVWYNKNLVGGLYGVSMHPIIFAESMFSKQSGASKLALYALMDYASLYHFSLVDAQITSNHVTMLGAVNIDRDRFMQQVRRININSFIQPPSIKV